MRWQYFSPEELKCRCGLCGSTGEEMDPGFMEKIVALREELGRPLIVASAYRCPGYNEYVSPSTGRDGPHTTGRAIDFRVAYADAFAVLELALKHGLTGLGLRQHGEWKKRFIHLDDLTEAEGFPRPRVWTYGG